MLYAIENGGFSGAIMPQNIVVGEQARQVAEFVAQYAGADSDAPRPDGSGSRANGFHCTSSTPASGGRTQTTSSPTGASGGGD